MSVMCGIYQLCAHTVDSCYDNILHLANRSTSPKLVVPHLSAYVSLFNPFTSHELVSIATVNMQQQFLCIIHVAI